jgi:NAD(P)-dependent dehydrogenase (short-subunit alcohol dehydrogenase family)
MTRSTAVVWGAAGGIGRALVQQLVAEDWQVVAVVHRADDTSGLAPVVVQADASSAYAVETAALAVAQEVETIDLWIYAAGDITSVKVADMAPETWQRILGANLTGAYLATHASLHLLARDAHLVYVGAFDERMRLPGLSAYAAAKAGLQAFVDALRKEERTRRVTLVRPAAVVTPLWEKVPFRMPRNALATDAVASRIMQAHRDGFSGTLDIEPA